MVNTQLIESLLTRLKIDAKAGCELKSSDFSEEGKHTLNVDAAHDAILYCQPHKHNDDTIFDDDHYDSSKENGNYPVNESISTPLGNLIFRKLKKYPRMSR